MRDVDVEIGKGFITDQRDCGEYIPLKHPKQYLALNGHVMIMFTNDDIIIGGMSVNSNKIPDVMAIFGV